MIRDVGFNVSIFISVSIVSIDLGIIELLKLGLAGNDD
jgi:hypothetical protein